LGRALTEGFAYQGQPSAFRDGKQRGESSAGLPLTDFISFLQNHDQAGNRAFGDRILKYSNPDAVRALAAILLLAPSPPLLFMGEEFAADTPFLFFCDFRADLAKAVTEGRRAEFGRSAEFADEKHRNSIPDPNAESTFQASKLNWPSVHEGQHEEWLQLYSSLLRLRQEEIVPLLRENGGAFSQAKWSTEGTVLNVCWHMTNRSLELRTNLGNAPAPWTLHSGRAIYSNFDTAGGEMNPWSVAWYLSR
jgi:maltooligosyltrehalose trehalohydrolase